MRRVAADRNGCSGVMAAILIAFAWRFLLSRAFVRGGTCGDISSQCYARHCPNCDRTTTIARQNNIAKIRVNTMTLACDASIPKMGTSNILRQTRAMVCAFAKHSFSQLTERLHAQLCRWKKLFFCRTMLLIAAARNPDRSGSDPEATSANQIKTPSLCLSPQGERGPSNIRCG